MGERQRQMRVSEGKERREERIREREECKRDIREEKWN